MAGHQPTSSPIRNSDVLSPFVYQLLHYLLNKIGLIMKWFATSTHQNRIFLGIHGRNYSVEEAQ